MPRRTAVLGQGLDALVSTNHINGVEHEAAPPRNVPTPQRQWEFACLQLRRKRRKSRLWLSDPGPSGIVRARRAVVADASPWAALVMLGSEGWELVGVLPGAFYFKRQMAA